MKAAHANFASATVGDRREIRSQRQALECKAFYDHANDQKECKQR
jgi:hypothetical protein